MSSDSQLFDDQFIVDAIDAKKYDRVARVSGRSVSGEIQFHLDINTELYPLQPDDKIHLVLASTLALDGSKDDGRGWREKRGGEMGLGDLFDYVCCGKIYRFEEGQAENLKVYVSFGGLLLYLDGPYKKLTSLRIDNIYLLIKK